MTLYGHFSVLGSVFKIGVTLAIDSRIIFTSVHSLLIHFVHAIERCKDQMNLVNIERELMAKVTLSIEQGIVFLRLAEFGGGCDSLVVSGGDVDIR